MPASNPFSHSPERSSSSSGMESLIQRLRLYRAPRSRFFSESDGEGDDVEERGEVFSNAGLDESSAVAAKAIPRPGRFKPKRAAVLICLFEGGLGELRVILTKRSSNLSTHSGEVSLPGGKAEEGDVDDAHTATREAKEEIGLEPSLVTVIAVVEPFLTKSLLLVVPVIGILSDKKAFQPVINAAEVETIFDAPLEMFLKDENRRWEERERSGAKFLIQYFNFETENKNFVVWGLTARILIRAASVVYQRPPCFPEQNPVYKIPGTLSRENILL